MASAGAEPTMVVDDVQPPEAPAVGELVADEVERPALHRPLRNLRRSLMRRSRDKALDMPTGPFSGKQLELDLVPEGYPQRFNQMGFRSI